MIDVYLAAAQKTIEFDNFVQQHSGEKHGTRTHVYLSCFSFSTELTLTFRNLGRIQWVYEVSSEWLRLIFVVGDFFYSMNNSFDREQLLDAVDSIRIF